MREKIIVDLKLSKECVIQCDCDYYTGSPQTYEYPGDSSELDIIGISFLKGGLMEYTQWCNDIMDREMSKAIKNGISEDCLWDILTQKCLEKYEESL